MEPAVKLRVGMGFVTGIDDRPFQGGLETNFYFEEISALTYLIAKFATVLAYPEASGAGEDLAGNEKRY